MFHVEREKEGVANFQTRSITVLKIPLGLEMLEQKPVVLELDEATGSHFLIFSTTSGANVDIRYDGDALWMSQAQIAEIFGRDVSVISRHIVNILEEGELDQNHLQKMQMNPRGGPSSLYSLDMVISVGYRVSSTQATLFRRWATDKLVQFASKGFVIDAVRLKNPDSSDRLRELRDIVRDIRSDEANVYRELKRVCSLCQDYDSDSPVWLDFYKNTQAKLVYAVTTHTPSEIVQARANSNIENMGLTIWPNENIRKADVSVSKNYLGNIEIAELNRLSTILLDIFEDQMDIGRLKTMNEAKGLLDSQLANLGRQVLGDGGHVSSEAAKHHAEREYEKFKITQRQLRHANADVTIKSITETLKNLPKAR